MLRQQKGPFVCDCAEVDCKRFFASDLPLGPKVLLRVDGYGKEDHEQEIRKEDGSKGVRSKGCGQNDGGEERRGGESTGEESRCQEDCRKEIVCKEDGCQKGSFCEEGVADSAEALHRRWTGLLAGV